MAHLYDKQVRWKQTNQLRAELERKKEALEVEQQHTFTPQIYTKPLKEFDGSARKLTENFKDRHVQRQMKARQQKEQDAQRVEWRNSRQGSPARPPAEKVPLPTDASNIELQSPVAGGVNNDTPLSPLNKPASSVHYMLEEEHIDLSNETVIEMLERERLQWQKERLSLVSCIELQQRELSRRAVAVHEKAAEIAREFAKTIEMFEERLMTVETSVQRELTAMRTLADTMRDAVASQRTPNADAADIDQRLGNIEKLLVNLHSRLPANSDPSV